MKSSRFSLLSALAAVAASLSATVAAKDVRTGIEAWERSDYAAAVAIWQPLAENGDADAAFNLGQAFRLGRGVAADMAAAQRWFERAARADHLDAQATLGLLLFDAGRRETAMEWLKKAAGRGEPRAMLVYGTALFTGDTVARDPVLGYAYVRRAAEQGLAPARSTLAELDRLMPAEQRQQGAAVAVEQADDKVLLKRTEAPRATKTIIVGSGGWMVQLGAFSSRAAAEALFTKVGGIIPGLEPSYTTAGAITRLRAGPFESQGAAEAACRAFIARGQACFAVPAK